MYEKRVTIKVEDRDELEELLNEVNRRIRNVVVIVRTRLNTIDFALQGDKEAVKTAAIELRRIATEIKYKRRKNYSGYFAYSLRSILKSINLSVGIPINVALEVLKLKGYKVNVSKGFLQTNADLSTTIEIFNKLGKIYEKLTKMNTTASARKAITYVALLMNKNVDEAIKFLEENKCIDYQDEKIVLTRNIEEIKTLIKSSCEKNSNNTS